MVSLLKNIELNLVMATIGHGEYSREIGLLRESLISIMPGNKNTMPEDPRINVCSLIQEKR